MPASTSDSPQPPTDGPLGERYRIDEQIGSGGLAVTYRGEDTTTGAPVAIRELALERVEDWKSVELFEREAEVLQRLDHRSIPTYIDAFSLEDDAAVRHYLVQQFIDGDTLRDLLHANRSFDETRVRSFLGEMLETLAYLHERKPPVVHRDLNPSNIMRRADGGWALVDFGVVQQVWTDTVGGSTFVGTSGYTPPEQAAGRSVPASDLYALGATAVEMLAGRPPGDFPSPEMKLRFRGRLDISEQLADFLERLLEPVPEDRFADGAEALEAFGQLPNATGSSELPVRPAGQSLVSNSSVSREVTQSGDLLVRAPVDGWLTGLRVGRSPRTILLAGIVVVLSFLAVYAAMIGRTMFSTVTGVLAVTVLVGSGPRGILREIRLEIDRDNFRTTFLGGWPWSSKHTTESLTGNTSALRKALHKRVRYGDKTRSVSDHLPAADQLDWLITDRLDTSEAEALLDAIRELDRSS